MRAKFLTVEEGDYTWARRRNYSDPCDNGLELKTVQALVSLIIDSYGYICIYTHKYIYIHTQTYIKTCISLCQLRGSREPNSKEHS